MASKLTRKQAHDTNAKINLSILNTMLGQVGGLYLVVDNERVGEIDNHAAPSWLHDEPEGPALVEFDMGVAEQSFFVGAVMKRSDWDRRPRTSVKLTDGSIFVPFDFPHADEGDALDEMLEWMEVRAPQAPFVLAREKAAAAAEATAL